MVIVELWQFDLFWQNQILSIFIFGTFIFSFFLHLALRNYTAAERLSKIKEKEEYVSVTGDAELEHDLKEKEDQPRMALL